MKPFIRVERLSKIYPESLNEDAGTVERYLGDESARQAAGASFALRDVSFEVKDGERVGLIGANGAGKTTLMRILAGLARPSSGSIAVSGKLQAILTIGTSLRRDMTGRENLLLAARLAGHAEDKLASLVEEMVAFAELDHFIDWPVRTYSSGMQARLSFAGAIFIDPEILLIDEALSVGDRHFSAKASEAVRKLCDGGRIVMIVSHSTEAIVAMCERCIWLENGRVVMDGPARDVADAYEESMRQRFERAMVEATERRNTILDPRVMPFGEFRIALAQTAASDAMPVPRQKLVLSFGLKLREALEGLAFDLRIERLDGVLVAANNLQLNERQEAGSLEFELDVPDFFVNAGIYLVGVDVSSGASTLAQLGGQIQIATDTVFRHGAPVLDWPVFLNSHLPQAV